MHYWFNRFKEPNEWIIDFINGMGQCGLRKMNYTSLFMTVDCRPFDGSFKKFECNIWSLTYQLAITVNWLIVVLNRRLCLVVISVVPYSKVHLAMVQNHYSNLIQSTLYDHFPIIWRNLFACGGVGLLVFLLLFFSLFLSPVMETVFFFAALVCDV